MKQDDPCRFCRIYAIAVVALAALVGVVMTLQMGIGLNKFGGHEYIMRVLTLSSVRSLAPGVAGSALMIAFVVWAHPLPVARLEAELPRFLKRGMLVSLPGYAVAVAVSIGVGFLVSRFGFGVSWDLAPKAFGILGLADFGVGAFATLLDAALLVFLASRYLPKLQASRSSLPMKLILVWTFGTGLRLTVALLGSLFMPS